MSHALNLDEGHSTSMIVPVWVSPEHAPSLEVLTHALQDTHEVILHSSQQMLFNLWWSKVSQLS